MDNFEKVIEIILSIVYIVGFFAVLITIALSDPNGLYIAGAAAIVAIPALIVFGFINSWYDNGSEDNK